MVGKDEESGVGLSINEHGGVVGVLGKDGTVLVTTNEQGGSVAGGSEHGGLAVMSIDQQGGFVTVHGNDGKLRALMNVNEHGKGAVSTWDKNAYRLK